MNRFYGLMPSNEIEKEKYYKDSNGLHVAIQAGPNGWTIIFADGTSEWDDVKDSTDMNFEKAYSVAEIKLGTLKEMVYKPCEDYGPDENW